MRSWPHDPSVAHLIFVDHQRVPTRSTIDDALEHARRLGARAVRTSALFPAAAAVVSDAGFTPIDRLALLRLDLDDAVVSGLPVARHRVGSLRAWMHRRAAIVDLDAFGPLWGNDAASLRNIRTATPFHHARVVADGRHLHGFAISGAAADNGYLQRIAVTPDHRRVGIAESLAVDALGWMHDRGRHRALVNTGVDNEGALALYRGLGFDRLDDVLTIAERRLGG